MLQTVCVTTLQIELNWTLNVQVLGMLSITF
jgi:hypothetical protein